MSKKLKTSIFTLIVYLVVFGGIVLVRFPNTPNDLLIIETDGIASAAGNHLIMADKIKTDKSASVHYLLQDHEGSHFIISARRFPFFARYDLTRAMPMSKDEIYETSDFYNRITISWTGNALELKAVKRISTSVYLLLFLLFVILVNIIYAYKEQKSSLNHCS